MFSKNDSHPLEIGRVFLETYDSREQDPGANLLFKIALKEGSDSQ